MTAGPSFQHTLQFTKFESSIIDIYYLMGKNLTYSSFSSFREENQLKIANRPEVSNHFDNFALSPAWRTHHFRNLRVKHRQKELRVHFPQSLFF